MYFASIEYIVWWRGWVCMLGCFYETSMRFLCALHMCGFYEILLLFSRMKNWKKCIENVMWCDVLTHRRPCLFSLCNASNRWWPVCHYASLSSDPLFGRACEASSQTSTAGTWCTRRQNKTSLFMTAKDKPWTSMRFLCAHSMRDLCAVRTL